MDSEIKKHESPVEEEKNKNAILSNDNVDVDIEPDVKSNRIFIQCLSCSIILNCCLPRKK